MTRVYLIADFGEGPRVYTSRRAGPPTQAMLSSLQYVKLNARGWWLVEAESADAARAIIADAVLGYDSEHPMRSGHDGRILDSGAALVKAEGAAS